MAIITKVPFTTVSITASETEIKMEAEQDLKLESEWNKRGKNKASFGFVDFTFLGHLLRGKINVHKCCRHFTDFMIADLGE